jgi:MFS family permease
MMTSLALPWFVLVTSGSPARTSVVLAAEIAPILILGIPSGKVAARLGARRTLLLTQLVAAPLVAAIPILHYAGWLTLPLLLVLVFALGTLWTPYYAAQTSIVPDLVGEDERSTAVANAILQGASRSTYWLGPLTAGFLISVFDAPIVLLIDAATFAVGFLLLTFVPERGTGVPARGAEDVLSGVRFIAHSRFVRATVSAQAMSQASYQALMLALPVLAFVVYESAAVAGLLAGAWGAGALAGSIFAVPLTTRRPALQLAPVAWAVQSAPLWLLVLPLPLALLAAALVVSGIGNGVRNPPTIAVTLARVPRSLRTQVFAAANALGHGGGLMMLIVTGPAIETVGLRPTFAIIAALSSAGTLVFIWGALRAVE